MTEVLLLCNALQTHFTGNLAKMKCLSQAVLAMLMVKTVNLSEIATAFKGTSHTTSNYRRLQRWLITPVIALDALAQWVINLFDLPEQITLALDRTNWQFGKTDINIFMLSVCHKRLALPLFWILLRKRGNSSADEKIMLIQKFICLFGIKRIKHLLGDREFAGKIWFAFLCGLELPFIFSVKSNYVTKNSRGQKVGVKALFQNLQVGEIKIFPTPKPLLRQQLYLAGVRLQGGQLRIVATNIYNVNVLDDYMQREEVEYLFGALKTRGFNFENTHLRDPERISNLLVIITIAYCWSYRCGDLIDEVKPIKCKNHGRRIKSVFRYGYDVIRKTLINLRQLPKVFLQMINFIQLPRQPINRLKLTALVGLS